MVPMASRWHIPVVRIIQRKSRAGYWLRWSYRGARHCVKAGTWKQALTLRGTILAELRRGILPQSTATWTELCAAYESDLALRTAGTRREALRIVRDFARLTGPRTASDLTSERLDAYLAARAQRSVPPLSPATLAKDYRTLAAFFSWCVRRGHLAVNPAQRVQRPHVPPRIRRAPEDAEWLALLEQIHAGTAALDDPQGWHLLILLAVVTGLRQAALLAIQLRDVDFGGADQQQTALLHAVSKGQVESYHGLPPVVTDRLAARIAELPPGTERLFRWRRFGRKAWVRLCRAAGFRHSFHALRRASATRLAEARALSAAAGQLGHADPQVTRAHYLDIIRVQRAAALALTLPDLPPLPDYRLYATRGGRRARRPK